MEEENQDHFNKISDEGDTMLHLIIFSEKYANISPLLEDVRCKNILNDQNNEGQGNTEVYLVEGFGKVQINNINIVTIKHMAQDGIVVLQKNIAGNPSGPAADELSISSIAALMSSDVNSSSTPLHLAVITDQAEIVKQLVSAGALKSTKLTHKHGDTAQHLATRLGKTTCLEILCNNIDEETLQIYNDDGDTVLHTAVLEDNYAAFKLILEKVEDVNFKNSKSFTPLHCAVEMKKLNMVKDLLERGADVNVITVDGDTPLHFITSNNQRDIAMELLQKGAAIDVKNNAGKSPHDQADKTLQRIMKRNRLDRRTRNRSKRPKPPLVAVEKAKEQPNNAASSVEEQHVGNINLPSYPGKKARLPINDHYEEDSISVASSFQPDKFEEMLEDVPISNSNAGQIGQANVNMNQDQIPHQMQPINISPHVDQRYLTEQAPQVMLPMPMQVPQGAQTDSHQILFDYSLPSSMSIDAQVSNASIEIPNAQAPPGIPEPYSDVNNATQMMPSTQASNAQDSNAILIETLLALQADTLRCFLNQNNRN
eukprot:gene12021-13262_t